MICRGRPSWSRPPAGRPSRGRPELTGQRAVRIVGPPRDPSAGQASVVASPAGEEGPTARATTAAGHAGPRPPVPARARPRPAVCNRWSCGSNGVTATTLIGSPRVARVTYRIVAGSKAATDTGGKAAAPARDGRTRYTNVRAGGSLSTSSGNGLDPRGQRDPLEPAQVRPGDGAPRRRARDPDPVEQLLAHPRRGRRHARLECEIAHASQELRGPSLQGHRLDLQLSAAAPTRPSPQPGLDGGHLQRARACGGRAAAA